MARLFLALWPDVAAREELAALSHDLALVAGGKPVPADKIHLTLAFLGEVAGERQADIEHAAAETRGTAFELAFDRVGSFRGARVAWAGMAQMPAALAQVQSRLAANLRAAGFTLEDRPFTPHVTLVRKIERTLPKASIPAIASAAHAIALVRTQPGTGRYTTVESWPLREN
jgi:2'-5' RNA ligase